MKRHALAIGAILVMAFAAPSASAAIPSGFFGVVEGGPLQADDPGKMATAGVTSYRSAIRWSQVQPSAGTFDWSHTDEVVGSLAANGIGTLPFIYGTPSWLDPSPKAAPLKGRKKRMWAAFLKAAVQRYGPGGVYWAGPVSPYHLEFGLFAKPVAIRNWQIWNEPNFRNYWEGSPSPTDYAHLVETSHAAIAGEDRGAKIVLAGLKPTKGARNSAPNFLDRMYEVHGIKKAFDATALHPYPDNIKVLKAAMEAMRAAQVSNRDATTPLWMTELGWGSGKPSVSHLNKGLQGQKKLLQSAFRLILQNRKRWNIGRLFWFSWRDGGNFASASCDFCKSAGLLNVDGSPKPSYYAYKRFAK